MTCADFVKLLASCADLSPDTVEHLRLCPACRRLEGTSREFSKEILIDQALERRLIGLATKGLTPVQALKPWRELAALAVATAVLVLAGVAALGVAGWTSAFVTQKLYFSIWIGVGLAGSAVVLSRLMIPGSRLPIPPLILAASAVAAGLIAAVLFPARYYEGFERAVAACLTIGSAIAVPSCLLSAAILRRGVVVARPAAGILAGLLGGLTAVLVLFIFCPHQDAGHYLLAHASVFIGSMTIGWAMADKTIP